MATKDVLRVDKSSDLLSFIINTTPDLKGNIELPVQGESIEPIGKIIMNNERYRNAFINTINVLGLTVIHRNGWDNPWKFTTKGNLNYGDSIREIILDLVDPNDYNEDVEDETKFLKTVVPDVYSYIHHLNYQKYYKTTTSDEQMRMAFNSEDGLFTLIDQAIQMLYESMQYDIYLVDKYMLCRRILDGTVTSVQITNYANLSARERVSKIKSISNKMRFRNPNYNPAGLHLATQFEDQMVLIDTDFEADFSTEVMATSFFKDEADMRARMELIDGFSTHDTARLSKLLKDAYIPFTETELTQLSSIRAVLMDKDFYQDRNYALDNASEDGRATTFFNPQTLRNNHFLHCWRVFATSPYKQCVVITTDTPAVTDIEIDPEETTVSAGIPVQLTADVTTTGFANKAVVWSVQESTGDTETDKVTVDQNGLVLIPKGYNVTQEDPEDVQPQITIKATSVFDSSKSATATITVL